MNLPPGLCSSEPDARPHVHRDHWKADVLSIVILSTVWIGGIVGTGGIVGVTVPESVIVGLGSAVFFLAGDKAQGWVWRRARRWPK